MTSKKIRTAPRPVLKYNPPSCPKHQTSMIFDKADSAWRCSDTECRIVARRKDDITPQPTYSEPDRKFHHVLEIIIDQDGEENYLIATTAGGKTTIVDVTDHVEMVIDEQTNSVTLCLLFNDVKRTYL